MSKYFDDLIQGLNEAVSIERGELTGRKTVYEIDPVKRYQKDEIRSIRMNAGMTQVVFADYMGVSTKTVEAWEKGTNHPTGSACRLLSLLESDKVTLIPFLRKVEVMEG